MTTAGNEARIMWEQYRKSFKIMQVFILLLCAAAYFLAKMPLPAVIFLWLALQLGSLAGAWWGSRIRRQIEKQDKGLPLEGKLRS
jgi:uncharacterized membrane protein YfcA